MCPAASGAHSLFDGMAPRRRSKKAPGSGGEDRISALPDAILQHVLGFLPADEAVRTCVLASRWRQIWTSLGRLRIVSSVPERWGSIEQHNEFVEHFNEFVNRLLLRREPSLALDEVEFSVDPFLCHDSIHINSWIRHALLCRASVLSASVATANMHPVRRLDGTVDMLDLHVVINPVILVGPALHSQHLAKLKLANVLLDTNFLDFTACPALEDLTITKSWINTHNIISQSVKRLTISECYVDGDTRIHISVPNLVRLWLHLRCECTLAPIFENMPSLDIAFVKLPSFIEEECTDGYSGECCGACDYCLGNDDGDYTGRSLLLGSLSSAKNLELIAQRGMPIFYRDLKCCQSPAFSKLKTLLLNEWCVANGLHALVCILEHSPVLEKLTLQLAKGPAGTLMEIEEIYIPTEQLPEISEHLSVVEIKCGEFNGRVCMILMFLSRFGRQIKITPDSRPSTSFSFE